MRFEKIPTGEYEPVTEFSAFGSCSEGNSVTIDISAPDRFGQRVSRYDDKKACKSSGFYFLSQVDGLVDKGFQFKILESATKSRTPASASDATAKKPFQWVIPLD